MRLKTLLLMTILLMCMAGFADELKQKFIYASVNIDRSIDPAVQKLGTGLFQIPFDGKNIRNLEYTNQYTRYADVFPDYGDGLIYCANNNGCMVSKNFGKSWRVTTGWEITELTQLEAVKSDPKTVYICTGYGLYKSTESGENFKMLKKGFAEFVKIDVQNPDRLYLGREDGIYISGDAGRNFEKIKGLDHTVNFIAQDPKYPDKMYLGTEDDGVFISQDRGKTWAHASAPADKGTVYWIAIDENNPDRLFASTHEKGVFSSVDGGKTWQAFIKGLEDIHVYCVAMNPDVPGTLYAGTADHGIYKSVDNGESWQKFILDGAHVLCMEIK